MKETGIIMSGNHPRLIIDGLKTMTRRTWGLEKINKNPGDWFLVPKLPNDFFLFRNRDGTGLLIKCPYGQVGDLLWVRETHGFVWPNIHPEGWTVDEKTLLERSLTNKECDIEYKADTGNPYPGHWPAESKDDEACGRWRPSLFMPRWASRITLEITGLRAERLQEIIQSDSDMRAEGIPLITYDNNKTDWGEMAMKFQELWDSLNAKRGYPWEANPWVWVIEFGIVGVRVK